MCLGKGESAREVRMTVKRREEKRIEGNIRQEMVKKGRLDIMDESAKEHFEE
jgi:hypothetical protein